MARPERFELPTTWFEARDSIQLSYGRILGFDNRTAMMMVEEVVRLRLGQYNGTN